MFGCLRSVLALTTGLGLVALIPVVYATECCLTRLGGRTYCGYNKYCCQSLNWPEGSNLYCCDSKYFRADSIYVEENCYSPFPWWKICLIVVGVFFGVIVGIAVICSCRKSRGFAGRVERTGSPPPYTGVTTVSGSRMNQAPVMYAVPEAYSLAPPSYDEVVAQDNQNK